MSETIELKYTVRDERGIRLRVFEGESNGLRFVRLDSILGEVAYCARLDLAEAQDVGRVLQKLGAAGSGPSAGGPR